MEPGEEREKTWRMPTPSLMILLQSSVAFLTECKTNEVHLMGIMSGKKVKTW